MSNLMPFIFAKLKKETNHANPPVEGWVVKIAHPDFVYYNSEWMDDENLGKVTWVPDVDICIEEHEFTTLEEARKFVKNWWSNNE